ncbi:insulinase family protein [Micrococcus sp. EYE_162]|uniref:insulinase family protein n=1 Tax=unclassified Micrococcus TaxID=2620948 RepID=UPI002002DC86|nr:MULTISPECIES: insulinase family protein [unclassified Micrococcus]MCK6095269.1 insulinase family protein [Micrococcus sp. EYE_212]MCK6171216.1 insulinase family protein [Micrococcus sp. EYE_162]
MSHIHARTVDGVEVHHLDAEGPLTADLLFRVGAADETVSTLGLSHLLEHLALDGVEGLEPDVDGESAMTYTVLRVRGTPERVADRLERICARLSALAVGGVSDAELAHARRVLEAEGGGPMADGPHAAEHLHHRLGAAGFGLGVVPARFLARITPAEVADWAGTRFTAGNAMLVLSGPAPETLRLALPPGARRPLPETPFLERRYPAEYLSGGEEPSVSFVLDDVHDTSPAALVLLLSVLRARVFRTLRQEQGIVDDVTVDTAVLGRHGLLAVVVRCAEKDAVPAVQGVLEILRGLRDGGAHDDERQRAAQEYEADEAGAAAVDMHLHDHQSRFLGHPSMEGVDGPAVQAVSDAEIARLLSRLEDTLLVGFPPAGREEGQLLGAETLMFPHVKVDDGPVVAGEEFRPGWAARMGGFRLRCTVGAEGIGLDFVDGSLGIRWDDVVAWSLGRDEHRTEVLTLEARDGSGGDIPLSLFKNAERLRSLVLAHLPERLRLPEEG